MTTEEMILHNDCLSLFNADLYSNIFTKENIISKKKNIPIEGEEFRGYFLEKGLKTYFVPDEHFENLPFKVIESKEFDYKTDVFTLVKKVTPITIPTERRMSFRELIGVISRFQHSNKTHQILFNICMVTAWCDRVNFRASTETGFGKDSSSDILAQLVNSTVNLYGKTFAKLEYSLTNKLIVLNELGNLKPDDKIDYQEFLLATGAYRNVYTKRSRKSLHTQEQYDVSKLSLVLFYNLPSYYTGRSQEYFEQMFPIQVANRFIPFVFEGRIISPFEKVMNFRSIVEENKQIYKDMIATLNYYRENNLSSIKYIVPKSIHFGKDLMRYDRSFSVIGKYLAEYSESEEEFQVLATELFKCYTRYNSLIGKPVIS